MKNLFCKIKDKFNKSREIKALFILGLLCLGYVIVNIFIGNVQIDPIDVVIRSQLIGIFGFIFGVQTKCEIGYYDRDLQFIIAFAVALVCLISLIAARLMGFTYSVPNLAALRDLMAAATGFLIGQSKK